MVLSLEDAVTILNIGRTTLLISSQSLKALSSSPVGASWSNASTGP